MLGDNCTHVHSFCNSDVTKHKKVLRHQTVDHPSHIHPSRASALVINTMFPLNMTQQFTFLPVSICTKWTAELWFLSTFILDVSHQILSVPVLVPTLQAWKCLLF